MSAKFDTLSYQVNDGVAWITIDREPARNAINSVMGRELPMIWEQFKADATAHVGIVTGRGTKAFCTGADLTDLPIPKNHSESLQSIRWSSRHNEVWKPVIAAVNGMVIGGGLHFVADADIVLAADSATLFDTHVAVGLVAGLEPVSLCRRMPLGAVLKMALVGGVERMSAAEALRLGMVDEVLPADRLLDRAFALAKIIGRHSPAALARTKQAIWQAQEMSLHAGLENAYQLIVEQGKHPDFKEGGRAFLERRAPRWQSYSALDPAPYGEKFEKP
jgi:enoyl-CoA hydratase/carnithine racemase